MNKMIVALIMIIINGAILGGSLYPNCPPIAQPCEQNYNFYCYGDIVDTTCKEINDPVDLDISCAINLCADDLFKNCFFNKTVGITIKQKNICNIDLNPREIDERAHKVWEICLNILKEYNSAS